MVAAEGIRKGQDDQDQAGQVQQARAQAQPYPPPIGGDAPQRLVPESLRQEHQDQQSHAYSAAQKEIAPIHRPGPLGLIQPEYHGRCLGTRRTVWLSLLTSYVAYLATSSVLLAISAFLLTYDDWWSDACFGPAGVKLPPEAVVLKCSFPPGRPKERK